MRRFIELLALGLVCVGLLAGCGEPSAAAPGPTATAVPARAAGTSAVEAARAFIAAWERHDAAALEALLTPGARDAWANGGGMSKWLLDQRGARGELLAGNGRVLRLEESGGTARADVAVAYSCSECSGDGLPDWPPAGSVAVAVELTLAREPSGLWLVSYMDGSDYPRQLVAPTYTVLARATSTAYAASMRATREVRVAAAEATSTARTAGAAASSTAQKANLNATATTLWQAWFPQATPTVQVTVMR